MNRDRSGRRESARTSQTRNHFQPDRKTLQLCRQVEQALHYSLLELDDPELADLTIESVSASAGDARLHVVLVCRTVRDPEELARLQKRLSAARSDLRSAIASAIHRRRTPQLSLLLRPESGGEVGRG